MSGGYTPVFRSIFTGTLFGKYPDLPLWLVLLAMADKNGDIDAHPSYISAACGIPQTDVEACITRFCEADPASRTPDDDGRRLVPIEGRGFGWRIVNHSKYREKARKAMHQIEATATGRDAERKRLARERSMSGRVQTSPDGSGAVRLSDSDTNNKKKKGADAPPLIEGLDPKAWEAWIGYRQSIGKALKPASHQQAMKALAKYGSSQMAVVEQSIANGWQGLFELKAIPRPANKIDPREWM